MTSDSLVTLDPDVQAAERKRAAALCDHLRFAEARVLLHKTVATDPQDAYAWCLLARAELGLGDSNATLQAAGRAASLAPAEEWPYRLASIALGRLGHHAEAITAAREAVRLAPESWQPYARLARELAHDKAGLLEALGAAGYAAVLAPDEAEPHVTVGVVEAAAGQQVEAEAAFRRALAIQPDHSVALNELARLQLGDVGPFAGAEATVAQPTHHGSPSTGVLWTIAACLAAAALVLVAVATGGGPDVAAVLGALPCSAACVLVLRSIKRRKLALAG
jgi:tetratricopeptide (TPR) repeat protein